MTHRPHVRTIVTCDGISPDA